MEEIHNATEAHPSVIRGLFFIVTPEENDIEFKVLNKNCVIFNYFGLGFRSRNECHKSSSKSTSRSFFY